MRFWNLQFILPLSFSTERFNYNGGLGLGLLPTSPFGNLFFSITRESISICARLSSNLSFINAIFKTVFLYLYINLTCLNFTNIWKQNTPILFTFETEVDGRLTYLDSNKQRLWEKLTSVHRKPIFTGLDMRYFSLNPRNLKTNFMVTLLQRTYNLSSNNFFLHREY